MDVFTTDGTATSGIDYTAIPAAFPRTVTFAPGETSLSIVIPTLDDTDAEFSETFSVNITNLTGANPGDLTGVGTILDNEPPPPGITVSPTSGLVTTEAGGSDSFTVVLDAAPTADVTIGISSSDTTEGTVSTSGLTFTTANWNTPQTVTVTGVDDTIEDGNIAYTIVTAAAVSTDADYNGLDASDVAVINQDDDAAGVSVTGVSPNSASQNQQLTVTVTGTGFVDGATVDFGTKVNVQGVTFISSSQLDVSIKVHKRASTGSRDVTVTNPDNSSDTLVGGFNVTAGLLAETVGDGNGIFPLSQADAEAFAEFALQLWIGAEGISDVPNFDVIVADLPGNQLGMAAGNVITLDIDAAGVGWFVDTTPFDDSEFDEAARLFGTAGLLDAANGYDLLTAAAHEIGHALGFDHESDGVMSETLAVGERHLPGGVHETESFAFSVFDSNSQENSTSDDSLGTGIITSPQPLADKFDFALENDFDTSLIDDDFVSSEPVPYLPEEDLDAYSLFSEFQNSLLDDLLAIS